MGLYLMANGPMPTTAAQAAVTTGTVAKTMLQLKHFNTGKIVEWGISFDGSAAATPIKCELLDTGTVAATVTAFVDADITKWGGGVAGIAVASVAGLTLGTGASGYTATVEGTITAVRMLDPQFNPPTNPYVKQYPLGREPELIIGNVTRIRVTAPAAVNCYCYMIVDI